MLKLLREFINQIGFAVRERTPANLTVPPEVCGPPLEDRRMAPMPRCVVGVLLQLVELIYISKIYQHIDGTMISHVTSSTQKDKSVHNTNFAKVCKFITRR